MKLRLILSVCLFVFASVTVAEAQDKTSVRILDSTTIQLKTDSLKPLPRAFVSASSKPATYSLYEVESPDPEKPCRYERCINPWKDFLDDQKPPECNDTNCQIVTLHLSRPLPSKGSFLLLVNEFEVAGKKAKVSFNADATAEVVGPWDAYRNRQEFRVRSNVPVQATKTIQVARTVTRVTPDSLNAVEKPENMTATLVLPSPTPTPGTTPAPSLIHSFTFEKKLSEGNEYDLTIAKGITDPGGHDLLTKGKLKIPGAATPPDDPKISLTLSSNSAVHQKSFFDFGLNYAPLHSKKAFDWGETPVYFEPSVVADLGLRSTKSNNSITFYFPLTMKFDLGAPYTCKSDPHKPDACKDFNNSNIPLFARWARTPWTRFAATKFYAGPKFEFDRTFHRRNVLGSFRFDFLLYRWMGSVSYKRGLITAKPPQGIGEDKATTLEGINTGLKITPYLSFDVGGHVNNETVEKEVAGGQTLSLVVPRHNILRSYLGLTGTIEWRLHWPMTLTLDDSVVYIGARETIGYPTDTGLGSRQLRGFHPHFKTQWDIVFDPGKHFSFNVTFENGRLAPDFEYLNKLTSGIKVRY